MIILHYAVGGFFLLFVVRYYPRHRGILLTSSSLGFEWHTKFLLFARRHTTINGWCCHDVLLSIKYHINDNNDNVHNNIIVITICFWHPTVRSPNRNEAGIVLRRYCRERRMSYSREYGANMFFHNLKLFLREVLWIGVALVIFYALIITVVTSWRNWRTPLSVIAGYKKDYTARPRCDTFCSGEFGVP